MLLGFKKRFASPIQIGTKVFTMRNRRKVMPKIGETLYMYSGLRTANTELISNKEKLMSIQEAIVFIHKDSIKIVIMVWIDKRLLSEAETVEFVKFDGFADRIDFANYWLESSKVKKAPVMECGGTMDLYHWTDLRY